MKVALVGADVFMQKLLYYGFLNNLYRTDQKIEYHIWGAGEFGEIHADFATMNDDEIVYHENSAAKDLPMIAEADRIIMTDGSTAFLDALTQMTTAPIYLLDLQGTFVNVFGYEKIYTFGELDSVLTTENIRTDTLQRLAKQINYEYEKNYGSLKGIAKPENEAADKERLWAGLTPFLKSSNIVAGDYHTIRLLCMKHKGSEVIDEEICELEHIRWCRYHTLNHWKCGCGENGKKDAARKLHPCLIPFADLTEVEKWKDKDVIQLLLDISHAEK